VTLPLAGLNVQLAPRPPAVTATLAGRTVQAVSTGTCAITYTSPVVTAADGSLLLALPPGGWLLSVVGDTAPAVAVTTAAGVDPVAVPLGVAS